MSSISSTSSSTSRITGMVSGIDTDAMVEDLMEAERIPLNKLYQEQQLLQWTQEAYQSVISKVQAFSDKYFDLLGDDCILSQSNYKQYSTSSSNEAVVTVTAGTDSSGGSHTITVSNLATAATYKSNSGITKDITASSAVDYTSAEGQDFVITLDGERFTITIDSSVTSASSLQSLIDNEVGSGKVSVSEDSNGYLSITSAADSGVYNVTISDGADSALASLGFSSEDSLSNRISTSDTLESIAEKIDNSFTFDSEDHINLTINGVDFEFDKTDTLEDMMNEINDSDAGVTMAYSKTKDTFTITANDTGAGNRLSISETDSTFLSATGLGSSTNYTAGEDSVIYLDGEKITRSNNSVEVDGITYELHSESESAVTVSASLDTDSIYDMIESFVNDYNTLISELNSTISEEYDSDYPPLTSDEKEEMSDDEIALWEKKAKVGLLENDSMIENMLTNMRGALYSSVSGVTSTLYKIGITTSSDYADKGKLEIDEDTLRSAIESDPDEVMSLFSKTSETYPGTTAARSLSSTERAVRTSEEGLAYKLYDIIQDNISTYRNSGGYKGSLLEKAGISGDTTEYTNSIYKQLDDLEDEIDEMEDKLADKEDYYYEQFSTMETYISNMNTQLSSLSSMLSS